MIHTKISLAVSAAAIALLACCCPLIGLVGGVRFTPGDFVDAPAYPGAIQAGEPDPTIQGIVTGSTLLIGEAEWKHYTTQDLEGDILDWYRAELPTQGWVDISGEEQGQNGLLFAKQDARLIVFVIFGVDDTDRTHILLGRVETAGQ